MTGSLKQIFPNKLCPLAVIFSFYSVRKNELTLMSGTGDSLWTTFYDTLSSIRQYHAKYPNASKLLHKSAGAAGESKDADESEMKIDIHDDGVGGTVGKIHFTAEEAFGSRVDMHDLYERYVNLPQFSRSIDYITFLTTFHLFDKVSREKKIKAQREDYRKWLCQVRAYLFDFHSRIRPLVAIDELRAMIRDEFEEQWQAKTLPGWFSIDAGGVEPNGNATNEATAAATSTAAKAADSSSTSDAATTTTTTAAATTDETSNPLYCKPCGKLFAKQTVFDAHLPGKKHKKNLEILSALGIGSTSTPAPGATHDTSSTNSTLAPTDATSSSSSNPTTGASSANSALAKLTADCHALALIEYEIRQFALLLSEQIQATHDYLVKKSTRTYEEITAELLAQQEEIAKVRQLAKDGGSGGMVEEEEEEEEDENAPIYNPLNIPLGFDGKPIPYWLYKLNGLNLKFDCEICGGFTYLGPRNFERHFTEWRHAYGMRALGIPNTKHFAHITKIDAAVALFEKLKKEGVGAGWRPDDEEEYEDSEGNVFNKRTYLELQRQGLL